MHLILFMEDTVSPWITYTQNKKHILIIMLGLNLHALKIYIYSYSKKQFIH